MFVPAETSTGEQIFLNTSRIEALYPTDSGKATKVIIDGEHEHTILGSPGDFVSRLGNQRAHARRRARRDYNDRG